MNCEVFDLSELEVEHYQIREVLRCILHTIMFNRALGVVRPKDVDSELFDITYVQCGDAVIEKKIEEKIDHFCGWVEKHPNKKGQVCLSFYEKRSRQSAWFTSKEERLYWEQWFVHLHVIRPQQSSPAAEQDPNMIFTESADAVMEEKQQQQAALEAALRDVILQILRVVNEKKDHIPPVISSDIAPFPYEIIIPSSSDSSFGMDMFKRMLQTSPPTMLS
eukprot:TRINITY_DN19205_c0_g1_i1.p1 TRINITY_DN19205_c0_g1~~TRINITY_DN19205_c0_g1_i1.p1  ORF type:complete len:220 (+),score=55.91 TRINITY_DN19205_c0_g1_i1:109-768(+)